MGDAHDPLDAIIHQSASAVLRPAAVDFSDVSSGASTDQSYRQKRDELLQSRRSAAVQKVEGLDAGRLLETTSPSLDSGWQARPVGGGSFEDEDAAGVPFDSPLGSVKKKAAATKPSVDPSFADVQSGPDQLREAKRAQLGNIEMRGDVHPEAAPAGGENADFFRNVASGMKQGVEFVARIPQMMGNATLGQVADLNNSMETKKAEGQRMAAVRQAMAQGDVSAERLAQIARAHPDPTPVDHSGGLPQVVEDTFESARGEREALAARAAQRGAERGDSPASAALAYAVPQTIGNILDPTMLLGGGEAGKLAGAGERLLGRQGAKVAAVGVERGAGRAGEAMAPDRLSGLNSATSAIDATTQAEALATKITPRQVDQAMAAGIEPVHPGFGTKRDAEDFGAWLHRAGIAPQDATAEIKQRFFDVHNPAAAAARPIEPSPELRAKFPNAKIDAKEVTEGGGTWGPERRVAPQGEPPAGVAERRATAGLRDLQQKSLQIDLPDALDVDGFQEREGGSITHHVVEREGRGAPGVSSYATKDFDGNAIERHVYRDRAGSPVGVADLAHSEDGPPQIELLALHPESGQAGGVALSRLGKVLTDRGATLGPDATVSPQALSLLARARESGAGGPLVERIARDRPDLLPPRQEFPSVEEIFADRAKAPTGEPASTVDVLKKGEHDVQDQGSGAERAIEGQHAEEPAASFRAEGQPGQAVEGRADGGGQAAGGRVPVDEPPPEPPALLTAEPPAEPAGLTASLKNAATEPAREARGLPPVVRQAGMTDEAVLAAGKKALEEDPGRGFRLAKELAAHPRVHTEEEVGILLRDRMRLQQEERAAMDGLEAARAAEDGTAEASAKARLAEARDGLDVNDQALVRSGGQWGSAGRLRQLIMAEDYSVSRVLQRARLAAKDGELPAAIEGRLADLTKRVEETSTRLTEAQEKLAELQSQRAFRSEQRQVAHEGRRVRRAQTKEQLDDELAALSAEFAKKTNTANVAIDPTLIPIMAKMARNRVKAGANTAEAVVDSVYQLVKDQVEGITPRDVRDALSGYGQPPKPTKAQATAQLGEVKRQMRLLSKLEDAEAGKVPAKGQAVRRPSARVQQLQKQVRASMKRQGLDDSMRLEAYRGRLTAQKAKLEEKLASGDFTKVTRREPVEDAGTRSLKVEINELKDKIDTEVMKLERANRTGPEKAKDFFVKWRRSALLSSSATLEKLYAAAQLRTLGTTPIEQLIGGAYAKMPFIRDIAAKAPREGSFSLRAEAKAFASAFSKETYKDAWATGTPKWAGGRGTGKSELDILYGHKGDFPPEVLDFFGHLHAGLKTLAKRPEFERSLELRAQWARRHSMDLADPVVQANLAAQAYGDAQRAILLQDNALVDAYKAGRQYLLNKGKKEAGFKGLVAAGDFFLPIVKVPSNYVVEAMEYGLGPARALNRVIWKGGIAGLEEKDAEYVMRNLKKGTFGAGLLALGYYGYDKVGGYYQRGEQRAEGDIPASSIRMNIFGHEVDVPHNLLHAPVLEMVQIGATLHKLQDAYADKGKEDGTLAGVLAGTKGLAEQVPFYGELLNAGEALNAPSGFKHYAGNLERSIFLPPDLQQAARIHDQDVMPGPFQAAMEQAKLKHFTPVKRKPTDYFVDQMKTGIPWLREQVPE